jgi:hypothetical protein
MPDAEIIDRLALAAGGHVPLAEKLSVTRQTLWNWKQLGIFKRNRLAVAAVAKDLKVELPPDFVRGAPG